MPAEKVQEPVKTNGVTNERGKIITEVEDDEDNLSPDDLSELLAEGTKESHDRAENCQFVKDFLRGRIQRELFKRGTVALYFVYTAMEEEIERNRDHPQFAPIYFPTELHRREALARDLEYFYGEDWEKQVTCSPGTQPYVDRIHEVGREDPVLLVAHSYTRYMGDLSGGQILKKVAQRALKLPSSGEGLHFYQFEGIHSTKAFKQLYRSRMNELEMDQETKERIIAESNLAFKFNMEVFTELEEAGKSIKEEVMDAGFPGHGHGDMDGDINKCPYYSAKMVASGNTNFACQLAMMLLRHPVGQMVLASWAAAVAGLAAWYLM
ncbi:heme oxygenase 2-like [Salvelinus fontinalis]|uniref:heme oxygenase 2-like n=1 Tax=Salvelinus fontinalis TaxID=8038 RepID=UPI0024855821|nr:heme oxygenase 2-like [Salvelinus fontinalis]